MLELSTLKYRCYSYQILMKFEFSRRINPPPQILNELKIPTVTVEVFMRTERDLYLKTHNIYKRQTFIPPAGIAPAIPTSQRPQT